MRMAANKHYPAFMIRGILVTLGLCGILINAYFGELNAYGIILMIVQLVALDLILQESKIYNTHYVRVLYIAAAGWIFGAMLKILHMPYSDSVLTASMVVAAIIYTIRFIQKDKKRLLDFTKWLWLLFGIATVFLFMIHHVWAELMQYISLGMFFAMLLMFFIAPDKPMEENQERKKDLTDAPLDSL